MSSAKTINHQEMNNIIAATDECVMCGLCLPHCPTYSISKNEAESPRGRISLVRALYEKKLEISDSITSHLDHCLTCMNCEQACPANVDYEKIINAGRAEIYRQNKKNLQQYLLLLILSKPNIRKILKPFLAVFRSIGLDRLLPNLRAINLLSNSKNLLNIPHHNKTINKHIDTKGNQPNIVVMNSCAADLINDQTIDAAKSILSQLGCYIIPQTQSHCCGALHQHTGDLKTATSLRNKLLRSIEIENVDHIVSLASGCGAQIKRYPMLEDTPIAKQFSNKLIDVSELILQQLENNELKFKTLAGKVYLHKPCSQRQIINDPNTIERLLKYIPNIELVYFKDQLACCGAGGINTISETELADQLIENKVHEIKNSAANYLVSSNIGCALHFQARLKRENIHVKICHPISLLAQQVI